MSSDPLEDGIKKRREEDRIKLELKKEIDQKIRALLKEKEDEINKKIDALCREIVFGSKPETEKRAQGEEAKLLNTTLDAVRKFSNEAIRIVEKS